MANDILNKFHFKKKQLLNGSYFINDTIRLLNEIIDIYKELGDTQKANNIRVLLTQLELQNEALISRMKGIIND